MTLSLISGLALALAPAASAVEVTVQGVASGRGQIFVSLCTRAEFLGTCAIRQAVRARRGNVTVRFRNIAPGNYAVMTYHDENGNGRVDRTMFGIPAEGYGFSRDAVADRGPPSFDAAMEAIPRAGRRLALNLRY